MCEKRVYRSKKHAREAVMKMHETIRVYWCTNCRGYHTTQERYDKVANNARAWNSKAAKASNRRKKGRE